MKALEKRIAARLLSSGMLADADLEAALRDYTGETPLQDLLVSKGLVSRVAVCRAEAEATGQQFIELNEVIATQDALSKISPEQAWALQILPIWYESGVLTLATANPNNVVAIDTLRMKMNCVVVVLVAERDDVNNALMRYYGPNPAMKPRNSREVPRLSGVTPTAGLHTPINERETRALDSFPTQLAQEHASVSDVYSKPTMTDIPKMHVSSTENPFVEQVRRNTSSGEISHREFQRQARALRENGDEGRNAVSQFATHFQASSESTLNDIEAERVKRGAYEPPRDTTEIQRLTVESSSPAIKTLNLLIQQAITEQVQEVEISPRADDVLVRFRRNSQWESQPGYALDIHQAVIGRLRLLAGLELKSRDLATEHQILIPTSRRSVLATLHLEKSVPGVRAVIRFGDTVPLIPDPFNLLAIPAEDANALVHRMKGRSGGLLFITAPSSRILQHYYYSFLNYLAQSGTLDILSLERPHERSFPGVTPINCPNDEVLLASLANAAFMNPDVLGIASVENGTALNRAVNLAVRGTTTLACYTAPDRAAALACFTAAKIDPMNLMRAVIGHLHVEEVPKLCPHCAQPISDKATLPPWARELEVDFMEANGCPQCQGTGRRDIVTLVEYHVPDRASANGDFAVCVDRQRDVLAYSVAGEIDPRDVLD